METRCSYCDEPAVESIMIRTGEAHPAQDQRDTTSTAVIRFCASHWRTIMVPIILRKVR